MRILKKDLDKLCKLANTSKVEWGGTFKKENGVLKIDKMSKGNEYGMSMAIKEGDIPFHTHTKRMVDEQCANNYPSSADILSMIEDKIDKSISLHVVVTPTTLFYIRPTGIRANDDYLYHLDDMLCDGKTTLQQYIFLLKKFAGIHYENLS